MLAVPAPMPGDGVNVAVNSFGLLPLGVKPESTPPTVVMSDASNPTGASEKLKLISAVCPMPRLDLLLLIANVGAELSCPLVAKMSVGLVDALPLLPAASVYESALTVIFVAPELAAFGVKIALNVLELDALAFRSDNVPPEALISLASKPIGVSLKVNVSTAVSPAARFFRSLVITTLGAAVSTVNDGELPAAPALPAASEYFPVPTVILAVPKFVLTVGVKLASYTVGSEVRTTNRESVPPEALISPASNPIGGSENRNVMSAVWPARKLDVLLLMTNEGATVSASICGADPSMPPLPAASV